jgi:amino acid adenylation domain-containing protein
MKKPNRIDDVLALTPLQQGFLFHTLYTPDSPVYNIQMELALDGDLDEGALEQAWRALVARHTALRTSFVWERVEKPYQVVHRQARLNIARHDWRALGAAEQEQRRRACLAEESSRVFDLTRPPLMRLALIALAERKFKLIWTFHHIILEGWSAAIILHELWKCYGDLRAHRAPDLPPARPYAEFIHWLSRKDQGSAQAYWREKLKGFSTPTRLPIDRAAGSAVAEVRKVDHCSVTLPREFSEALRGLARTHRITLNTVVQGAWSILLSRYSGEQDVVFGAVLSGRPAELPGAESVVGLFVNTLPARVNVDANARLAAWLQGLQLDQVEMRQYEYSSLMQVQAWSDVPGGQPLFHTGLAFQNYLGTFPAGQVAPDLQVTVLDSHETSDLPLTLQVELGDALTLGILYDVERFDRAAVERMLAHCRVLIQAMVADPERRLGELPLLEEAEQRRLLVEWNDTTTDWPAGALCHDLFEAQADYMPDRVAVIHRGRQISYAELDAMANRMAHAMRKRGVTRGQRVGLCVERSAEMVAAVLAILKTGAAYVPLDPAFPEERLRFMAQDARLTLLVSTASLAGTFDLPRERKLLLDADGRLIASAPRARLPADAIRARPEDPAYVIYTSGSTGKPKGVVVPHRAAVNFLTSMWREPGLTLNDVLLAVTTLSFDIAVLELQLPLTLGATVVVASREDAADGRALMALLEGHAATVMQATPTTWRMLLQAGWNGSQRFKALVGGEALPRDLADQLIARGVELWNMYGPTETTVWSTCARISDTSRGITIGRPIANTIVRIVDARMDLCPIAVPGELCIGGAGVSLGYWNRPELTAERFVDDPFAPGMKLYRTGDLARWGEEGTLEHLGRLDFQVKLRGFRIELGEIEATLSRHPAVREAVVIAREDVPGEQNLVAYVVAQDPPAELPEKLRALLRKAMPEYMVPSHFVTLKAMPLTPNGKVDRKALPRPLNGGHLVPVSGEYVAPRNELEIRLASTWQQLLDVPRVGVTDNFFDLGGHSLLAAKLMSRLRTETGLDLRLRNLFEHPTVEGLAQAIQGLQWLEKAKAPNAGAADREEIEL